MRIGLFTDSYPPYLNGVATSVECLKKALEKEGHQVYVVTVNAEKMCYKFENNNKIIRIPSVPIGIYDYRLGGIYPVRVIKKIKKWNLDIIHSHTEFSIGTFARLFANEFDIPLVHTYHTMYEDYIHYITKGHFNKSSKKLVEYLTKFYCDKTCEELIVPTKKTYDLFKSKYKVKRNVHIVPTGLDIEKFYKRDNKKIEEIKRKYNISNDDFVLLFVGRIGKEKNIGFLIDAQRRIVKKYKNAKLLIVGMGPDEDLFKEEVKRLNLEENIILVGKVPNPEIQFYYHCANVFVTASKSETQGLTVIEALASSLPAFCINDESFNQVIINDLNGYLFNTKREYLNSVYKVIDDKEKLKSLSKNALSSSKKYSSKYYAQQILDVYEEAIKNKKVTFKTKLKKILRSKL